MKLLIAHTIVLLLLSSPVVQAKPAQLPANGSIPFSAFDTNGDGSVSEAEFNTTRSQRISQKAQEGRPMRGVATAPSFTELDSNKDGKLSPEELAQGQQQHMKTLPGAGMGPGAGTGQGRGANMPVFADYDRNGDGVIDEQEFNTGRGKRMSERAGQGYQMRGAASAPAFADIDANHDGRITADEFSVHQRMRGPAPATR